MKNNGITTNLVHPYSISNVEDQYHDFSECKLRQTNISVQQNSSANLRVFQYRCRFKVLVHSRLYL